MRRGRGRAAILLAILVVAGPALQLAAPAKGTSELFKTSKGETSAEVRIAVPPGHNDSLSFTLPSESAVQSARFDVEARPVRIPASLTEEGGSAFLNGSTLENLVFAGGSLRLADLERDSAFTAWQGNPACGTAAQDGGLSLARNLGSMYFTPNLRAAPSNQSEYDPAVAVASDDTVCIVWTDQREYDFNIYLARSLDRGATFLNATRINDDGGPRKSLQEFPDLAAGSGRKVYIVWTDNRSGDEDTFWAQSSDSGATFSPNHKISDGPPGSNQSHPAIAVSPSGRVAVAWEDDRNGNWDVRCAFSADGASFGPSVQVNTDLSNREQLRPRIAAGTAENVHLVWYDNRSGDFDIYYARSSGSGFQPELRVDDSGDSGTFQALPSVAVGPQEVVHVVWHDRRFGDYRVMYSSSRDGIAFSPNYMIDAVQGIGKDQFQPRVRVGPGGVVHVVWHDRRFGDPDIFYANSTSDGRYFNPPVRVDNTAREVLSYSPTLGIDSLGEVHVAWWDNRTRQGNFGYTFQAFYCRGLNPYFRNGTFLSPVIDLGTGPSGLVRAAAGQSAPGGTSVEVLLATATQPEGPWSEPANLSAVGTPAGPPPARYVQWWVQLQTSDPTVAPRVTRLSLDYSFHPGSGTFRSRPLTLPFALRTADMYWNEGKLGDGPAALSIEVSTNNGTSWQEARPGLPFEFPGAGRVLLYRVEFSGSSSSTPTLSSLFFDLRMESLPSDVRISVGRLGLSVFYRPGQLAPGESITVSGPELADSFNRAIQEARKASLANATLKVDFASATPGILQTGNIHVFYDLPPRLTSRSPEGDVALDEGGSFQFEVTAEDPENDPLTATWSLDGLPVEKGSLSHTYRPGHAESGLHTLAVNVTDGILFATASWKVTVRDVNRPPVILRSSPEDFLVLNVRDSMRLEVKASDPDGDLLLYTWQTPGPSAPPGEDYLDFIAPDRPGTYSVVVNISDGKETVSHSWKVDVYRPEDPQDSPRAIPWMQLAGATLLVIAVLLAAAIALRRPPRKGKGKVRRGRPGG